MENVVHLYFRDIEEVRAQESGPIVNYLRDHTVDRDYFSKLSVATSVNTPEEYLFSNYMDRRSFCLHTPAESGVFQETYMHKHNFFELMYTMRGEVSVMIEDKEVPAVITVKSASDGMPPDAFLLIIHPYRKNDTNEWERFRSRSSRHRR